MGKKPNFIVYRAIKAAEQGLGLGLGWGGKGPGRALVPVAPPRKTVKPPPQPSQKHHQQCRITQYFNSAMPSYKQQMAPVAVMPSSATAAGSAKKRNPRPPAPSETPATLRYKRNVNVDTKFEVASDQNWTCNDCNQQLDYTYEVDHITRIDEGGSNERSNLQALCRNCHGRKTVLETLEKKPLCCDSISVKKIVAFNQKWKCNTCNILLGDTYKVDHITRIECGGSNEYSNMQALCPTCYSKTKTTSEALNKKSLRGGISKKSSKRAAIVLRNKRKERKEKESPQPTTTTTTNTNDS